MFLWQWISATQAPTAAFLPLHQGRGMSTLREFALGLIFALVAGFLTALSLPLKKQLIPPCYHQGAYYADNKGHLLGLYPEEKKRQTTTTMPCPKRKNSHNIAVPCAGA